MKLYDRKSGLELKRGDAVKTFRGQEGKLKHASEPHNPSSTGRVIVEFEDGWVQEFFPSVINAVWLHSHFQLLAISPQADATKVVIGEFHNLASILTWLLTDPDEWPSGYDAYARDLTSDEVWWLNGQDDEWKNQTELTAGEKAAWPTLEVKGEGDE